MKVVYVQTMLDKLADIAQKADEINRKVDRVEVSWEEMDKLVLETV